MASEFFVSSNVVFGKDAAKKLPEILKEYKAKNVMVVYDAGVKMAGIATKVLGEIEKADVKVTVFDGVIPNPTNEVVEEAAEIPKKENIDVFVAVGGGSSIDLTKAVNILMTNPGPIGQYGGIGMVKEDVLPLIAIPTTAGTSSEITNVVALTDTEAVCKYVIIDNKIVADRVIADPEFTRTMPPSVTAATGMDVFTHALEACVSTDRSDFSTALAEKSIELVGVFLLRAYLDGNDTHARQKMHSASCLAGLAFNSASLGLNHGMAHQLGAKFHIPHGRANAMLLPHIIEFNSDINKHSKSQKEYLPAVKRYATVAQILGLSSYNEIMTVRSLVNWVQFMLKEMDIPLSISQMGTISEEESFNAIDSMADAALEDGCTATNPRVPNKEDVIEIYKKLWK